VTPERKHENQELANRLVAAADGIVNSAAAGLEQDLRSAAALITNVETQTRPLLSMLESALARLANDCKDSDVSLKLRRLIGEAQ
jgi:hypothetical protein